MKRADTVLMALVDRDLRRQVAEALEREEGITREIVDAAMLLGVRQVLPSPEGVICIPDVVERLRHVKEKRDSREFVMAADPLKHRPTFRRQAAREHDTGRWPDSHGVVPGRTASRRR